MSSALVASQSAFAPRKEFIKHQAQQHIFALLVFNGSDILRMSNFPPNVIASLRSLFEAQKVYRAFREDIEMGVSEFIMADKLWVGKNLRTERLVTLIFSTILSHNFRFVTPIAYGRIQQDTNALVFSKPMPPHQLQPGGSTSRSHSPAVPASPLPGNDSPTGGKQTSEHRACFALSLTSKTLRVLCPPKSSMPAILSCVRTAWPRGIVSEGRPADDVYEFNLRGYSMFSSSTFDRDALVHVFALLRSLDTQGFNLVTSTNLTPGLSKSRSKDLWIFDAPADPPSPPSSEQNSRHASLNLPKPSSELQVPPGERVQSVSTVTTAGMAGLGAGYNAYLSPAEGIISIQQHMRSATAPTPAVPSPLGRDRMNSTDSGSASQQAHVRAATSPTPAVSTIIPITTTTTTPAGPSGQPAATLGRGPSVLRKAPPPTFLPGEKPKRKNSKGSFTWSLRGKRDTSDDGHGSAESPEPAYLSLPAEEPVHKPILDQPPPPPLHAQQSYMGTVTSGPLSESEYAYGYGGGTPGVAGNTNSEYLYGRYQAPVNTTAAQAAVIYRTTPPDERPAISPSSTTDDGQLLSADVFRGTAYSGTTAEDQHTVSGSVSPGYLPHSHSRSDDSHGTDKTPQQGSSPRTGNAPLPHQPEIAGQSMYSTSTGGGGGRPKSEKAFMGVMPAQPPVPPPSSYAERPRVGSRGDSTGTVLPPGGFPKTPGSMTPTSPTKEKEERPRVTSAGSNRVLATAAQHNRSASGRSTSNGAGKGWVLVNVEPSRKTSMDAAVAAMDKAHLEAQQQRGRASSKPTISNVRLNSPGAEAHAGALTTSPMDLTSPIHAQQQGIRISEDHPDADEVPPMTPVSGGGTLSGRSKSLKKRGTSRSGGSSGSGRRLFGLFGKKKRSGTDGSVGSGTEE